MTQKTPLQHTLVFAMAHEIGNQLGAIRLQAHLLGLGDEQDPPALARTSIDIDSLASRAAPLLALLRPILSPPTPIEPGPSGAVSWSSLLDGLRRQIEDEGTRGIQIEISAPSDPQTTAPAVDWLQPLLMSLVGSTLDTATRGETILLSLDPRAHEIALVIEDDCAEEDLSPEAALRGRPLSVSIARYLLGGCGGRVEVLRVEDRSRVELIFPDLERL